MTSRSYILSYPYGGSRVHLEENILLSGNSPKGPQGKLSYRTNSLDHHVGKLVSYISTEHGDRYRGSCQRSKIDDFPYEQQLAHQQAYARLRGKLYKGNAALGVTFASLKQSRDMIAKRSNLIASSAEELTALSSKLKFTKRLADNYLETIFGWQPLIADIHAAATSVIQLADQHEFVRASASVPFSKTVRGRWDRDVRETIASRGVYRVSLGGQVRISNPNLWLLERAGLANPLAAAWDLVPWSFLINMFSNVGSLVNQISDFYGLSFVQPFTARRIDVTQVFSTRHLFWGWDKQMVTLNQDKRRHYGFSAPPFSLTFRTPDFSWGTAAMAASLMVQQAVPVFRMMSRYSRGPGGIPYTE